MLKGLPTFIKTPLIIVILAYEYVNGLAKKHRPGFHGNEWYENKIMTTEIMGWQREIQSISSMGINGGNCQRSHGIENGIYYKSSLIFLGQMKTFIII